MTLATQDGTVGAAADIVFDSVDPELDPIDGSGVGVADTNAAADSDLVINATQADGGLELSFATTEALSGARLVHLNALEGWTAAAQASPAVRSKWAMPNAGEIGEIVVWVRIQRRRLLGTLFWELSLARSPAGLLHRSHVECFL